MEVHILWIGRYFTLARPAKMFWLYLVLVLSAAVLVLVIVDCIIIGLRWGVWGWAVGLGHLRLGDSIEFHRQSVNVESIMAKDGLSHRNCSSITSTAAGG